MKAKVKNSFIILLLMLLASCITTRDAHRQASSEDVVSSPKDMPNSANDNKLIPQEDWIVGSSGFRGIPDPSVALGFDVRQEYKVTRTVQGEYKAETIFCEGNAAVPCLIDATAATFGKVEISGRYVVVKGGYVRAVADRGPFVSLGKCDRCMVLDMQVEGPGVDVGHSAAVELGTNVVWQGGKIFGFGDNRPEAREQDFHGIKTMGEGPTWILDAEIYDNSGDSVQVGDASRGVSNNVYIGGGVFYGNRENGVDIKDSTNIVVSSVTMRGFASTPSDPGAAIVIHDDAFNVRVYDNIISDTNIGIVSSGVSGHIVHGNRISASRTGIELRNTSNLTVVGNQVDAPKRIDVQGGVRSSAIQR